MKLLKHLLLLTLIVNFGCKTTSKTSENQKQTTVFQLDFENNKLGKYTDSNLLKDVGKVTWKIVENKASIEQDSQHGKVLKVKYPKGAVGPKQGGIQFDKPLPKSNEYYLDYYVKFGKNFDFALGGKLPGLTSGGEKYTGGIHPNKGEGWSARYMWREKGAIILYFYHMDMKHKWGDIVEMNSIFERDKWCRITQHLKMNDTNKFNGIMEVWVDGEKVVNDTKVRYRLAPLGDIDSFYFSTFHGGNTADWAPKNDSYCFYDDFKVTTTKPKGLE